MSSKMGPIWSKNGSRKNRIWHKWPKMVTPARPPAGGLEDPSKINENHRNPHIPILGYWDIPILGYGDIPILGYGDIPILGYGDIPISGYPNAGISQKWDIAILGYPDIVRWHRRPAPSLPVPSHKFPSPLLSPVQVGYFLYMGGIPSARLYFDGFPKKGTRNSSI